MTDNKLPIDLEINRLIKWCEAQILAETQESSDSRDAYAKAMQVRKALLDLDYGNEFAIEAMFQLIGLVDELLANAKAEYEELIDNMRCIRFSIQNLKTYSDDNCVQHLVNSANNRMDVSIVHIGESVYLLCDSLGFAHREKVHEILRKYGAGAAIIYYIWSSPFGLAVKDIVSITDLKVLCSTKTIV